VLACSPAHCLWNERPPTRNIVRVECVNSRGVTQHESIQSKVTLKVDPGLVSSHSRKRLRLYKARTLSAVGVVKWCLLHPWCLNRLRTLKLHLHRIILLCSHGSGYDIPYSCRWSCHSVGTSILLTISQPVKPPPIRVLNGKLGL
jgi:hypothetical protein